MKAKIFYVFALFVTTLGLARAQDPAIAGINPGQSPLMVGQSTIIEADILNGSSTPILQFNNATWTINLPPNIDVTGVTFDDPSVSAFLSVYISPYDPTGTTIQIVSDKGNFPGGGAFIAYIAVKGVQITAVGVPAPMSINAASFPPVGTNAPGNDNATSNIVIIPQPPVATPDVATTPNSATPVTVTLFTNDTPGANAIAPAVPDMGVIVPTSVKLIDPVNGPVTTLVVPNEGTYQVNPDGTVTFTPSPTFSGIATPVNYTYMDDNGGTSNQATITITVAALPVTLVRFNVAKEGKTAQLSWATTEESNSDRFEIEHSLNGKEWGRIGTVASHGESNSLKNYGFADVQPANGDNLYRLKMVDKDETYAYSRIQSLKFDGVGADLSIYPNPVADQLFIRDFNQVTSVVINDLNGRAVHQSGSSADGAISVKSLSAGMYVVRITRSNGVVSSQKIVIAK